MSTKDYSNKHEKIWEISSLSSIFSTIIIASHKLWLIFVFTTSRGADSRTPRLHVITMATTTKGATKAPDPREPGGTTIDNFLNKLRPTIGTRALLTSDPIPLINVLLGFDDEFGCGYRSFQSIGTWLSDKPQYKEKLIKGGFLIPNEDGSYSIPSLRKIQELVDAALKDGYRWRARRYDKRMYSMSNNGLYEYPVAAVLLRCGIKVRLFDIRKDKAGDGAQSHLPVMKFALQQFRKEGEVPPIFFGYRAHDAIPGHGVVLVGVDPGESDKAEDATLLTLCSGLSQDDMGGDDLEKVVGSMQWSLQDVAKHDDYFALVIDGIIRPENMVDYKNIIPISFSQE